MANIFVRSTDGSDADSGATWALAKATLAGALAIAVAGDTIFVSDNHSETQASAMTLASAGTAANPIRILCVDDTGDPVSPTVLAATAGVFTTGASSISFTGFAYVYGIIFSAGSGAVAAEINFTSASPWWFKFDSCKFILGGTGPGNSINVGSFAGGVDNNSMEWVNTPVQFAATGQSIDNKARFRWSNTPNAIHGVAIPITLFITSGGGYGVIADVIGVDLTALGAGRSLVTLSNGASQDYRFIDCKLGASVAVAIGAVAGQGAVEVVLINCDSADTNYRYFKQNYQGIIQHETTIVRSGGATDGTTQLSYRLDSNANTKFISPLETDWIARWNEKLVSQTVTLSFLSFGAAKLQDDEVWVEAEYLGTSGTPLGSFASDRMQDILATPADQTVDTSSWRGIGIDRQNSTSYSVNNIIYVQGKLFICTTGGVSDASEPAGYATANDGDSVTDGGAVFRAGWRQKASTTITALEKGLIRAKLVLAEPSKVVYSDRKLVLG